MKVTPASSSPTSSAGAAKPAADGFRLIMPENAATRLAGPGAAAAPGVSGVGALLALQSIGGPEARARAMRKGRSLLEALDRLQASLLGLGPTRGDLNRLTSALAEERAPTGDAELDETLVWAEVRAAVEAAKLERDVALA